MALEEPVPETPDGEGLLKLRIGVFIGVTIGTGILARACVVAARLNRSGAGGLMVALMFAN
jgi:hypothetical protein